MRSRGSRFLGDRVVVIDRFIVRSLFCLGFHELENGMNNAHASLSYVVCFYTLCSSQHVSRRLKPSSQLRGLTAAAAKLSLLVQRASSLCVGSCIAHTYHSSSAIQHDGGGEPESNSLTSYRTRRSIGKPCSIYPKTLCMVNLPPGTPVLFFFPIYFQGARNLKGRCCTVLIMIPWVKYRLR